MFTSILAFFKALAELLGFGKWIYNESKDTPAEKEQEIEVSNAEERTQAEDSGRPKWD